MSKDLTDTEVPSSRESKTLSRLADGISIRRPDLLLKLDRVAGNSRKLAADLDLSGGGVNGTTSLGAMMCV